MKKVLQKVMLVAAMASGFFAAHAQASVVIAGTRVVFPSQEREVTIKVTNDGKAPALVQTWIDKGIADASPDTIDVPFTLTPTMFRLDPKKGQTLRLMYTKEPLAKDKETLFWLNVLEIPPKPTAEADANRIQLAFRTRIKIMFRPQELTGKAEESPAKVTWQVVHAADGKGYQLKASNPTPYFVNLGNVDVKIGDKTFDAGSGFVKPGESELFNIADLTALPAAGAEVLYNAINDWGAGVKGKAVTQ
ncbi:Chaperone protein fimC precursor [Collimonas arenae]|uniref:Chaperone protein fimC n=1 Tax=Collimonas arenae TaxID=279058 RepID=A0A0A1FA83_9BURK|nr:fimbria/pilus periplasmic chaperone [Collimonas arenae]AIY41648.1 Chaperone protein fimC precursor [Collimonas arenae]